MKRRLCTPQLRSLKPSFPLPFLFFIWVHQEPSPVWAEKKREKVNFCKEIPVMSVAASSHFQPSSNQLMAPQKNFLHVTQLPSEKSVCTPYNKKTVHLCCLRQNTKLVRACRPFLHSQEITSSFSSLLH